MADLMSVDDALKHILEDLPAVGTETIALDDALGRVLAADAVATSDQPPFDTSSVDGYAVIAADVEQAPVTLDVVMDIPAGSFPSQTLLRGQAARIMTGAPMPAGADAIVMVEDTDTDWQAGSHTTLAPRVTIRRAAPLGANVRLTGENIRTGQAVITAGTHLAPAHIGVLASIGATRLEVMRRPRAVIMTSGDEVVPPEETPGRGQIRDSNNAMIAALVRQYGGEPVVLPIAPDRLEDVRAMFRAALDHNPDLLISSAGVSVGTADFIRVVLDEIGKVNFWRINLRPGKPLAYGSVAGKPFFGLPGNPVSAMVTFEVFVRSALLKMQGRRDAPAALRVIVDEDMTSDGRRSFLRVKLTRRDGRLYATSTGTQSSGALISMVLADALLIVPEGVREVPRGTELEARLLREIDAPHVW
jgi:molybdopterin molybdotransferase